MRLRHEGDGLALLPGGVLDEVLELHHVVGGLEQRVEAVVDLRLAGGADLVVGALDEQAARLEVLDHVGAQVAVVVVGLDGEVAALEPRLVALVLPVVLAGVPPALDGVDVVVALVDAGGVADAVEDVELGLGSEVGGVRDAGRVEVGQRLARDVARVARVGLAGDRVVDEEVDVQRLGLAERVEVRRRRVREQRHVGLVDRLEAADRGAVEAEAVVEDALVERRHRHREVLHDAGQVAEADVDHLDALVLDELEQLIAVVEHSVPPRRRPARVQVAASRNGATLHRVVTLGGSSF